MRRTRKTQLRCGKNLEVEVRRDGQRIGQALHRQHHKHFLLYGCRNSRQALLQEQSLQMYAAQDASRASFVLLSVFDRAGRSASFSLELPEQLVVSSSWNAGGSASCQELCNCVKTDLLGLTPVPAAMRTTFWCAGGGMSLSIKNGPCSCTAGLSGF